MTDLVLTAVQLEAAVCPEDVFGTDAGKLKTVFHQLLRITHPDYNCDKQVVAQQATMRLNQLKNEADVRVANGTFGRRLPLPEHEPLVIGAYQVDRKPLRGDLADVYFGEAVVLKVSRFADDNDLLRAERTALERLKKGIRTPVVAGVPVLVDAFQVGGATGWQREVNVLDRYEAGWVTAEQVHARMPSVDVRTLVWMFKRLLVLLEWTHELGLVHGAVLPPHVMVYPDNDEGTVHAAPETSATGGPTRTGDPRKHSIRLVDWCYSVEYAKRTRLSAWCPQWTGFYPVELAAKKSVGPASDIYMAACLVDYLAGDTELDAPLADVLIRCMEPDTRRRYQNCGEVFVDWRAAVTKVYGPPRWHDFVVPK